MSASTPEPQAPPNLNPRAGNALRRALLICASLGALSQPAIAQQETSTWTPLAERDWADLPKAAQDAPIPQAKGYLSREVAPGAFVVTEGLYQAMFVVTNTGVVVVDAPPTIGPKLLTAVREVTRKPVTHFIYSHSHIDHVGAASQFSDVIRIGSADTAAKLARYNDPNRPLVTSVLPKNRNRLLVGDVTFQLDTHGNQHEPGNLYISLPQKRVLMVVDLVFPGWVPFTNLGMAEDVQGFIDSHQTILSYDFDVLVGGHLSRPGTRADVETQRAYVTDLVAAAQAGQRAVDFGAVAKEVGFANRWLLVKTYMDRVAAHCGERMLSRWRGKLGGAAVSTPGHCWVMQEHLNINGTPRS